MSSIAGTRDSLRPRPLDPRIVNALQRFLQRTNFTNSIRGTCILLLTFLFSFGTVAALDYFWFVDDATRIAWSLAAYAVTILVAMLAVVRPAMKTQNLESLAGGFERAEPSLRNHLLSAVELGDGEWDYESPSAGSAQLRQLLQRRVANFIVGINVSKLIPLRVVQPWLNIAASVTVIILLTMFIPGSPVALLYARAVAPFANLARASTTKVVILKPDLERKLVPANEVLLVEALIEKIGNDSAWLEVRDPDRSRRTLPMHSHDATTSTHYSCNLEVREDPLEFRVLAGDAITAWYPIEPKPRPQVSQLKSTIQYPEYAQLDPISVESSNQPITVLFGSEVSIQATVNQPIAEAEIELVDDIGSAQEMTETSMKPLHKSSLETVNYSFGKIYDSIQYRLHFQSSSTGFENVFPETHKIETIEDSAPVARLSLGGATSATAVPRDLLPAFGEVRDELPVNKMVLEYSIDDQPWTAYPVNLDLLVDEVESDRWQLRMIYTGNSEVDLGNITLKEGDLLRLRLKASDRKGQTTDSNEVEVMITANYFTPERYRYLDQRFSWLRMIINWSAAENPQFEVTDIVNAGKRLLDSTPAGVEAIELELLTRAILSVEQTSVRRPGKTDNEKKRIRNAAGWFLAFTANEVIARDLQALHASAEKMVLLSERSTDSRNLRQLEILASNYESCIDQYRSFHDLLPDSSKRSLRGIVEQLQQYRERIESLSQDNLDRRRVLEEQQFQRQQLVYRKDNPQLDGAIAGNALDGIRDAFQLRSSHGKVIGTMASILREQSELKAKQAKLTDAQESGEMQAKLLQNNDDFKRVVLELDGQLTTLHAIHQARKDVNPQRLSDIDLLQRAVSSVFSQKVFEINLEDAFSEISAAAAILDAGQDVYEFEALLRLLALDERWTEVDSMVLRLENPRRWEYWMRGLELSVAELKHTDLPQENSNALAQLRYRDPAGNVSRTIGNRRWDKNWTTTASDELDLILANYKERKVPVDQAMERARQTLQKFLPDSTEESEQQPTDGAQPPKPEESNQEQRPPSELANLPEVELSELLENAKVMSAEEMLRALEEELAANPPMQQALSEISDQIVQQAVEQLERAAQDEYESERSLEQSDVSVRQEKEMAIRQLQDVAQQIDQVRSNVTQQARSVAGRAAAKESIDRLSEAEELLRDAASEARKASGSMLSDEIGLQAEKVSDLLNAAEEKLKAGKSAADGEKAKELESEPNRNRTRDQMKALQNTIEDNLARNAEQRERQWRQLQRNYETQTKNAERQQSNAESRLEKAKQAAAENPNDNGRQREAMEAGRAVERASQERATYDEMKKRAEALADQAQEQAKQIKQSKNNSLDANNPAAELAERLSERGEELTAELSKASQQIHEMLDASPGIEAEEAQFSATANQQSQIQKQVSQVADSLERAARHEQRLGSDTASARLQQAADAVRQLAESAIENAKQSAEKSENRVSESGNRTSSPEQGQETASALNDARQAIGQQLEALSQVAATNQNESQPSSSLPSSSLPSDGQRGDGQQSDGEQSSANQSENQQGSSGTDAQSLAETKARALDDLDRALNAAASQDASKPGEPANSLSQSATLTQASAEQASEAAQQAGQVEGNPQDSSDTPQQLPGALSPGGTMDGQASSQPFSGKDSDSPILKSMEDWGELRDRRTEDSTEGKRTTIPQKYQRQIEAYFRSISEKGNK